MRKKLEKAVVETVSKIEYMALGNLEIAPTAQRKLRPHWVDKLLANFDPELLGVPALNRRDYRIFVIDGWHRISALKLWIGDGWEDQQIQCCVWDDLTEAQEANLFLELNKQLSVSMWDKFDKSIVAGRKVELEIAATVQREGLAITRASSTGGISAIGTLYKIYERAGYVCLGRTLAIIRDAYGDAGFRAPLMDGIGMMVSRYDGELDHDRAVAALTKMHGGCNGLLNKANLLRTNIGQTKPQCVAASAVTCINRSKGPKLQKWFA